MNRQELKKILEKAWWKSDPTSPEFVHDMHDFIQAIDTEDTKEDFRDNMAIGSKPCRVYADNHELHLLLNRAVAAEMEVERWKKVARRLAGRLNFVGDCKEIIVDMSGLTVEELFGEER